MLRFPRLSTRELLCGVLVLGFLLRLLTLGAYPLTDTTEARYAEIARKMVETGNWLTPQIDYGVPFWGKPPLSFWLTALSYKAFGIGEFTARLPSLLLGIGVCALVFLMARAQKGRDHALRASVVFASSALVIASIGAVMTDPALLLGTALPMVAFWRAQATGSRGWGHAFFIGLAIGLLAKGPIATVLSLGPIFAWAVLGRQWPPPWRALPWLSGSALVVVLVVPWYWAAERATPGFLHYFLIGEHIQRFLVSGWQGDLYGSGHPYPRGTIWLFALLGTLPWSPWWLWRLHREGRSGFALAALRADRGWRLYLWCWLLLPMLFFTLSRNILPTYVLPALPAFALLVADAWQARAERDPRERIAGLGLVAPVALALITWLLWPRVGFESQKELLAACRDDVQQQRATLTYYRQRPYSAEFYSGGRAERIDDPAALVNRLRAPSLHYVVVTPEQLPYVPDPVRKQLRPVAQSQQGRYQLFAYDPRADIGAGGLANR